MNARISANTQQNKQVDNSPRVVAVPSLRISTGSPRAAAVSPRAVGTPRHNLGSPRSAKGSPKTVEVGEIDTRAPFQSVKAAVSLFGEASPKSLSRQASLVRKASKSSDEERVLLERENQLNLALNKLDSFKNQLRNSETTKAQALRDLDKARETLQELAGQLENINKSEKAATDATDGAGARVQQIQDKKFSSSDHELNSVKQQLAKLRHDFDTAMEIKMAATQKASRAQNSAVVNRERVIQLSMEVATLREALAKVISFQSQEEQTKLIAADKQASLKSLKIAKEEVEIKMQAIKEEFDPDLTEHNLKAKLDETNKEIEVLREQLKNAKGEDINAWKTAASELETAKKAMQEVVALENSLRSQVDSLKQEMDNPANKDQSKSKSNNPSSSKNGDKKENIIKDDYDMASKFQLLSSEAEAAIREAEEMKNCAESFRKEAEVARISAKEAEEKLEILLEEAKKAREISKLNGKVKLSKEEYESLMKKIEQTKTVPKSNRMSIRS